MKLKEGLPGTVGIDRQCIEWIREQARHWVENGIHPALVMLAARKGIIVLHESFGRLGPEEGAPPLQIDSIFPIASISKPITATAAMILVEEGRLGLNRPVVDYIPEFSGDGQEKILIRQLLTHTSGLRDDNFIEQAKREGVDITLDTRAAWIAEHVDEYMSSVYRTPPWTTPDTMMVYTDQNYDLLGEVVGRITGIDLSEFCAQRIFQPLGMVNTAFILPEAFEDRLVRRPPTAIGYDLLEGFKKLSLGSAAAYATAGDIAIFGQMFLNRGTYDGQRILSPASVEAMTRNQIPGIPADLEGTIVTEAEWGLGWSVHETKRGWAWDEHLPSASSFGHGGLGGTFILVDPAYQLVLAFFSVYLDLLPSERPNANTDLFINSAIASIEE
jgi:CubicO group peptidase (beta-lactamase class C family)